MAATLPFTQWIISLHGRGTHNFVLKLRPPAKSLHVNAADLWPAQPSHAAEWNLHGTLH